MNQVEQVDLMQTQILGLKELIQMVAVIDTCASRGTFKVRGVLNYRKIKRNHYCRESTKHKIRQQSYNNKKLESLDGGVTEGNETSEPVVDAREKLKRSKGKK